VSHPGPRSVAAPVRLCGLLMLLVLLLMPAGFTLADDTAPEQEQDSTEIALVTMGPGEEYWSRFGHNAIWVRKAGDEPGLLYNYGYFDFEQPNFLLNFLRGQMLYTSVAISAHADLAQYRAEDRDVRIQWLNLTPDQTRALVADLERSVLPAHADYRYDYFLANCSTRVRDALDRALDGGLRRQLLSRSRGMSHRQHALRHAVGIPWLFWGMHIGLGPDADRALSLWSEGFIPADLMRGVADARTHDGEPLVRNSLHWHRSERAAAAFPPDTLALTWMPGLALAALLALLAWQARRTPARVLLRSLAALLYLALGLGGLFMAGLWLFTEHWAAAANENLFLFNPLWLLAIPAALRLGTGTGPASAQLIPALTAVALLGLALKVLPAFDQDNLAVHALLLPALLVLAFRSRH
jgi:hypothetical protein